MERNELIFPWGESNDPAPPAPLPPISGFAEIKESRQIDVENNSNYFVPPIPEVAPSPSPSPLYESDVSVTPSAPVNPPPAPAPMPASPIAIVSGKIVEDPMLDAMAFINSKREEMEDENSVTPTRINPDSRGVLYTALALVFILMASSFTVSFSGIYDISQFTGIPTWLQFMPALFIDAAILAYTISFFVFKARGEGTVRTMAGLLGFAALSVFANIAHTLNYWNGSFTDYRAWIGVAITAAAPIAVLLASEEIARLAFIKHDNKQK